LPIDFPRRDDVLRALAAVGRACEAIVPLQPERLQDGMHGVVNKQDLSPITVADFTPQAIVLHDLRKNFSEDSYSFIVEESSTALQDNDLARQILQASTGLESLQLVKDSIDLGQQYNHWSSENPCLDPIDGTKGSYGVAEMVGSTVWRWHFGKMEFLLLVFWGAQIFRPILIIFNYAWNEDEETSSLENMDQERGCIFVASLNGGCYQVSYRQ
jgi:hypothetical protein